MTMGPPTNLLGAMGLLALLAGPPAGGTVPRAGTASTPARGPGRILAEPPAKPDSGATYLFYLHGRIVQEQGRGAVSPKYGPYEYDAIPKGLAEAGLVVISEPRPRGTEPSAYAGRVAGQVERLLEAGVPARRITIVGASMGGFIAMLVSNRLAAREIGYVFMGSCDEETLELGSGLHGEVLSIFEASDELEQSCARLFARASDVGRHAEVRIDTGLHHGFLYRPLSEWMGPVIRWARARDA
ncbi:MAG TPA: alpha/beta hydrolase [Candidatus Polarisedimenticolia bacterium]|jgi:hypothetical protein|nr:alpha/beta hydrolase [Candidatus Polarisedimenticolia bacterium]